MYIQTHGHTQYTHFHVYLVFSVYIKKKHEFALVPLIPVECHRVHPIFLLSSITISFLTVRNLLLLINVLISSIFQYNQPPNAGCTCIDTILAFPPQELPLIFLTWTSCTGSCTSPYRFSQNF